MKSFLRPLSELEPQKGSVTKKHRINKIKEDEAEQVCQEYLKELDGKEVLRNDRGRKA